MTTTTVLYFDAPEQISIRREPLAAPTRNQVQVRTYSSAISSGTEMLFYRGLAPTDMAVDAVLPGMDKPLTYPLRYGYACVGEVCALGDERHKDWLGQRVFAFQPHMSHFNVAPAALIPIPTDVDTEAAALFPNMETAISLVHDGAPLIGERVMVFGQGIVGLLTTWLLAALQPAQLVAVDPLASRRKRALSYGAHDACHPDEIGRLRAGDPDLIFELTGNPAALRTAVSLAGYQARIIVGSWYGTKPVELALGQDFHRNRITLYSSQVSTLPSHLSARWDKARRYQTAWEQLSNLPYLQLITHRVAIAQAQRAYAQIATQPEETCQVLLTYNTG